MDEVIEDISDTEEWRNPCSSLTTAGLSYKAMRLDLGKKKLTEQINLDSPDDSVHKNSEVSTKRSKQPAKPKKMTNEISNATISSSVLNENFDSSSVRVTRSRATRSTRSNTSNCESSNQVITDGETVTTRRGRRARNPRRRRSNVTVLNAEPIEILDSPTNSPRVSTVQGDPIELNDSDVETGKQVNNDLDLSLNEDENSEMLVRVWWKHGKIDKFNIRKFQKLVSIFQHYAKQENVSEENILLTFKDVKIQQNDTPDSLGLVPGMIIDGGVCGNLSSTAPAMSSLKVSEPASNKDDIELRIQRKDMKMALTLRINKTQKMKVLMLKCAEQLDLPLKKLKFYFDGEAVNAEDTPEDLDLEGDECIDLHVLQ